MGQAFSIVIADRNRHVREFLRRELRLEGYKVHVAKNDREVLSLIEQQEPDLLILDLEIPYAGGLAVLEVLRDRNPPIPVVIHTFLTEYATHPAVQSKTSFVEKAGNTDCLKAAILEMLWKFYPHRFGFSEEDRNQRTEDRHDEE